MYIYSLASVGVTFSISFNKDSLNSCTFSSMASSSNLMKTKVSLKKVKGRLIPIYPSSSNLMVNSIHLTSTLRLRS